MKTFLPLKNNEHLSDCYVFRPYAVAVDESNMSAQ